MLDLHSLTLRDHLRQSTSDNHARVDALFSTLDLTAPVPLGRFLAAHRAGFAAMRGAMRDAGGLVGGDMLLEMISALDQDLACLSTPAPSLAIDPVGPDAIDHIVLGSRLGTAVLKRHWSTATDPRVRTASRYFSLPGQAPLWRAHTDRLTSCAATGPAAERLVTDTKRLYRLFERAFHHVA